ncbi:MAG: DHH family phosphoesterase [Planctomycetes bacterium]|nr:DHH family phosphoesterase [Planctomycetota bacterium]
MPDTRTRKRWRLAPQPPGNTGDPAATGLPPLIARLLQRRGITWPERVKSFLDPRLTDLHDPALIPGVPRAARRIADAVRDAQRIVIYGDYDVDGITASAILWHLLTLAGARVETYVPHRIEEGYGLNSEAIRALAEGKSDGGSVAQSQNPATGEPASLIISVDCGITAIEPARVARECGVDLVITDHHEFDPANLPDAFALVHPRLNTSLESRVQSPESKARESGKSHAVSVSADAGLRTLDSGLSSYPFPHLCGAGVAFKLAWQTAKTICGGERLPQAYRDLMLDLLSLAALGTVADIVPLLGENRVITSHGLGHIKRTRFTGLNALIEAAGLGDEKISAYDVGFKLGPRLNASGRMGHAREAVHLLTAASDREAPGIAAFLTSENEKRRATEREIFEEAKQMVVQSGFDHEDSRAIVLGKEGWHPGVVGIVASRIVEAFARPAVLLSYSGGDDGEAHGSARSVEGVSIHEAIGHCAAELTSYGGHAMAAGLRLEVRRVEKFRAMLVEYVNGKLAPADLVGVLDIDAECALDGLTAEFFAVLEKLAPFGRGNPAPLLLLSGVAVDRSAMRMGGAGKHLSVQLRQNGKFIRAVGFGLGDFAPDLAAGVKIDIVAEPVVSRWQGERRPELHIKDLRVSR